MQDSFASVQRVLETDELPGQAGELFGREKWLCEETLQQAGAHDDFPVLGRKLLQTEHGDDVLEFAVLRECASDFLRQGVMPFADNSRRGHLGVGLQRINGREKPFTRPLAREHDGSGEMREGMHRRRIGEIVRRHIDRLDRGDGAGIRVGNALLQT